MMVNKKSSIRKKSQGDYQKEYVSGAIRGIKGKLFLALAVLMLCACSSDDELENSFSGANVKGSVSYLIVNLKDVNSLTRATDGGFASGTEAEQKVANAYFYFYDDNGNYIARGNVDSTTGIETGTNTNIEWNSGTVVAVWGLDDYGNLPTKMLTVINQPSSFNITNKTLSEAIETLAGTPYADASGNFVMSTSVYGGGNPFASVNCTALTSENFALEPIDVDADYGTSGDAKAVEVYVERLAAKVGVSNGITGQTIVQNSTDIYALTDAELAKFPMGAPTARNSGVGGIGIQLQGWNIDGVARDAYVVKNINDNANWNLSFTWNASSYYRCYWAESPNYGDTETVYPTSSKGHTATEEASSSTGLNEYLRYVDLQSPIALGNTTYCGENTNTTAVLGNASSTGLTNIIVKAQFVDYNTNASSSPILGIDIVEYLGSYYTVADFCQTYVYKDFDNTIGNAITALESESDYSGLSSELEALKTAAANGSVYKTLTTVTEPTIADTTSFGGEMLSLYNAHDGNVTIGYNTSSTTTDNNIVYSGLDLDDYNFWFSVDPSGLTDYMDDLTQANLLVQIGNDYYIPLSASITFTVLDVSYSMRSYFISALAADATATNNSFGTSYPNYYNGGLMYYHVPIEHLAPTPSTGINEGQYGVVRNHWYDVTITSLSSFGRGIAVEDEVIVPISDNGTQTTAIGASTKIYSWKEYDQTVIF